MARIRYIKPDFFTDEHIVELDFAARLLFIGLWTLVDRDGRMEYSPKQVKLRLFPDDRIDIEAKMADLADKGRLVIYEVDRKRYIEITNFAKHQRPHPKEAASSCPAPPFHGEQLNYTARNEAETPKRGEQEQKGNSNRNGEGNTTAAIVGGPVRVSISEAEQRHLDTVMDGLRERLNVNTLRDEQDWVDQIHWAHSNKFTADQVLECFDLLTKQKWRKGRVTPKNVGDNLPELKKLRAEIAEQDKAPGKPDPGTVDPDRAAQIEAEIEAAAAGEVCWFCKQAGCSETHQDVAEQKFKLGVYPIQQKEAA